MRICPATVGNCWTSCAPRLRARELAKYVLSRDLSDALEGIAAAGQLVGLSRPLLSGIPFGRTGATQRIAAGGLSEAGGRHWAKLSARHAAEQEKWAAVALPPVLGTTADLRIVEYPESTPNFVTRRQVRGRTLSLGATPPKHLPPLRDRIVLLESADPGFDWIFNHHPPGIGHQIWWRRVPYDYPLCGFWYPRRHRVRRSPVRQAAECGGSGRSPTARREPS